MLLWVEECLLCKGGALQKLQLSSNKVQLSFNTPPRVGRGQIVSQMVSCGYSAAQANIIIKGVDDVGTG